MLGKGDETLNIAEQRHGTDSRAKIGRGNDMLCDGLALAGFACPEEQRKRFAKTGKGEAKIRLEKQRKSWAKISRGRGGPCMEKLRSCFDLQRYVKAKQR